jgi:hypothetical protein
MKRRNFENLRLNKEQVSNLQREVVKGGGGPAATELTCNTVPRHEGGLGCHLK